MLKVNREFFVFVEASNNYNIRNLPELTGIRVIIQSWFPPSLDTIYKSYKEAAQLACGSKYKYYDVQAICHIRTFLTVTKE